MTPLGVLTYMAKDAGGRHVRPMGTAGQTSVACDIVRNGQAERLRFFVSDDRIYIEAHSGPDRGKCHEVALMSELLASNTYRSDAEALSDLEIEHRKAGRPMADVLCKDKAREYAAAALRRRPNGTEEELLGLAMRLARGAENPARVLEEIRALREKRSAP